MDRIAHFQNLLEKHPDNLLFRFSLAQALIAADRGMESIPHLQACANGRTDWMVPRILLGKEWIATGHKKDAEKILNEALHLAVDQHHEDPEAEIRELLKACRTFDSR